MSTESNRQTSKPSPTQRPSDLQASDFFPPGEGWNQDEKPAPTYRIDRGPKPQNDADRQH